MPSSSSPTMPSPSTRRRMRNSSVISRASYGVRPGRPQKGPPGSRIPAPGATAERPLGRTDSMRRTMLALAATLAALTPATASGWAPASTAPIHPGVQTYTDGGQCTANFVFTEDGATYIGQAAHCAGTGAADETDGCKAGSRPLGTPVEVGGANEPGTLAYSSWLAMQSAGEK